MIIISMITMSCSTNQKKNNSIELPNEWKFKTGDNTEYSKSGF
jgi:hypothetical protein